MPVPNRFTSSERGLLRSRYPRTVEQGYIDAANKDHLAPEGKRVLVHGPDAPSLETGREHPCQLCRGARVSG